MQKKISKKILLDFEDNIKKIYEKGKIKGPIHLSGNNEENLIKIFKKIKKLTGYFRPGETITTHFYTELVLLGLKTKY